MKLLLLLLPLLAQDTTGISPRARSIIQRLPQPTEYGVSMTTRFSRDTVWSGEQVDMVTAAWFPRDLRQRLRRSPMLRAPALSGLWSATGQTTPILADTRRIDGAVYDLFVTHQVLFPLTPGDAVAPPAVLSYGLPAGSSFFSPEQRFTVQSAPARLAVRPIPVSLRGALGNGPTAREVRLSWRTPAGAVAAGTPVPVELVVSGMGNVALWPAPDITWPAEFRVYTEPAAEQVRSANGVVQGDKRFRFTLVAESPGSATLPVVSYAYFDPTSAAVRTATAAPVGLTMVPAADGPAPISHPVVSVVREPVASLLVHRGWPALVVIGMLPLVPLLRRRRRTMVSATYRPAPVDELQRLLGRSLGELYDHAAILRQRGVPESDAGEVAEWLASVDRGRWGGGLTPDTLPAAVERTLTRLREGVRTGSMLLLLLVCGMVPLAAQSAAVERFAGGDAAGAARLFEEAVRIAPRVPGAWTNLAAARWAAGDEVGAGAAWLRALTLAPRDSRTRAAWRNAGSIPADVRSIAPTVPVSGSEAAVTALVAWLAAGAAWWSGRRRAALVFMVMVAGSGVLAVLRFGAERRPTALARPGVELRISPLLHTTSVGSIPSWSTVRVLDSRPGWRLVDVGDGRRGWVPDAQLAELAPLD